jgi:hypothetical protein
MGGKRTILPKEVTKKLPKEPKKGKKHPFTAGPALVDVGIVKLEGA